MDHRLLISSWFGLALTAGAGELSFNRDIRPILSENCFYCHGQDGNKRKADMRLDDRAAAIGKKAFVPGDAAASELVKRIFSTDPDEQMPPPDSHRILSAAQR
jgi:mono/diheme cytochrome c family protein